MLSRSTLTVSLTVKYPFFTTSLWPPPNISHKYHQFTFQKNIPASFKVVRSGLQGPKVYISHHLHSPASLSRFHPRESEVKIGSARTFSNSLHKIFFLVFSVFSLFYLKSLKHFDKRPLLFRISYLDRNLEAIVCEENLKPLVFFEEREADCLSHCECQLNQVHFQIPSFLDSFVTVIMKT